MDRLTHKQKGRPERPPLLLTMRELLTPLFLDTLDRCFDVSAIAEGGEAEVAFPARAETAAGGTDHVALVE